MGLLVVVTEELPVVSLLVPAVEELLISLKLVGD
jgi:hypothetical protein